MSQSSLFLQKVLLYLLIVIIGLYAGMLFFHEMCPVETQLSPLEYASYWKIVDGTFMSRRMAVMGPMMIGLFLVNVLFNIRHWRSRSFLLLFLSFLVFVTDVGFTLTEQLPINKFILSLDLEHMTDSELAKLKFSQAEAIKNFRSRTILGVLSFMILCLVPFSQGNKEI